MLRNGVDSSILCMLAFTIEIKNTYFHPWTNNFGFVVTYMFQQVIEFRNKKLFLAFYLRTNNITYLMHITFAVYYRFCLGKTQDPLILKVSHNFMISFFSSLLGLDLKYRLWSTWLRMNLSFNIKNKEDGFEFQIGWVDKGGNVVIHGMHKINFIENVQFFPQCWSFSNRSFFIDCFSFSLIDHFLFSLIDRFLFMFINCS